MKTNNLIILALAIVSILGLAGCSRQEPPAAVQQNLSAPNPAAPLAPAAPAAPAAASTSPSGVHRLDPTPAAVAEPAPAARRTISAANDDSPRYVTKSRSKNKSAAIIGGSAAAGAAIGAIAGGGKGAAIGALIGGGGGAVYDRKTAKKKQRVD